MGKQVDEVLGGQPDVIQSVVEEFRRELQVLARGQQVLAREQQVLQRQLAETLGVARGTREAVERDMPPRYFLLVPPMRLSISERVYNMFNPCSQKFHMYFVCRAFLDDLKTMENGIPDPSPEFSKPLLVKQSAVRP